MIPAPRSAPAVATGRSGVSGPARTLERSSVTDTAPAPAHEPPATETGASVLAAFGGSALGRTAQSEGLSWIPPELPERDPAPGSPLAELEPHHSTEPASSSFTTYAPPSTLALDAGEVDDVLELHRHRVEPSRHPQRAAAVTIPWTELPCHERLEGIFMAANAAWWRLDVQVVTAYLLRYAPGARHLEHTDMHPGSMQRKLSLSVQLSGPDDYAGGDLELRCWGELHTMPRLRGSVVAFPGWTPHRVTTLDAGERWALVVWGWGPPVR